VVTSPNGLAWTLRTSGTTYSLRGIVYGNGLYVAVGQNGTVLTSSDGFNWTVQATETLSTLFSIAYGNGMFVAVGGEGTILTSNDGVNWVARSSGTSGPLYAVAFGQGQFVAVGGPLSYLCEDYTIVMLRSLDGATWQNITDKLPTHWGLYGVSFINGTVWTTGSFGTILQSDPITRQMFLSARILPNSSLLELTILGDVSQSYRIQGRSNVDYGIWETLLQETNGKAGQTWIYTNTISSTKGFYRTVSP